LETILNCISELFGDLQLGYVCGFVLTHYGHVLVLFTNKYPLKPSACYLQLDIADLIDETHNDQTGMTLQDLTECVDRSSEACRGAELANNLSPVFEGGSLEGNEKDEIAENPADSNNKVIQKQRPATLMCAAILILFAASFIAPHIFNFGSKK